MGFMVIMASCGQGWQLPGSVVIGFRNRDGGIGTVPWRV